MTAKDSSGTNVNHGGDTFFVKITNQCTQGSNFACTEVSGARQTLSSPIQGTMTDNGDGTYTFNYSVPLDGAVTVVIQLLTAGAVYGEWFANTNWSGSPGLANYTSDVNFIWMFQHVPPAERVGRYMLKNSVCTPTSTKKLF